MPPGTWITGGDWDHTLWGGELPRRDWIDAVTPNHPVWVNRLDGHMALANSAALRAAGVTRGVTDVAGGEIVRDRNRDPTGVLKDNAMDLVAAKVPPPGDALKDRALDAAMRHVAAQGVTTVHNMGSWNDLDVFDRAARGGRLGDTNLRRRAAGHLGETAGRRGRQSGTDRKDAATPGCASAPSRVSSTDRSGPTRRPFTTPFTDAPGDRGLFVTPPEDLYTRIAGADKAGLHVVVHAIGDRANTTLLDIFERVIRENGPRDRRFRIEHAQHLAPADIPAIRRAGRHRQHAAVPRDRRRTMGRSA